jgi:hypothetical protein
MTGFDSKRSVAADKDALFEKFELAQPAQEQWLQAVTEKIEAALLSHRLSLHNDASDDGIGFSLVDALCCGQTSLEIGKREVKDIAEAIYHVLAANIPPATQPAQEPVAFDEFLESQDFYELMQTYRHCLTDAFLPFEEVKNALRAAHIGEMK